MEKKTKTFSLPGVTFTGNITVQGDMFNIHDNQNVYIDGFRQGHKEKETPPEEAWEMKELKFFSMKKYCTDAKQIALRDLLQSVTKRIDVNNGREWFCVYAANRYVEECTGSKLGYVEFFTDIETLLPGRLKNVNAAETGYKRYKSYSELLRREADDWFVFNGCLAPINELVYSSCYGCTKDQFKKYNPIIKDLYRGMKSI